MLQTLIGITLSHYVALFNGITCSTKRYQLSSKAVFTYQLGLIEQYQLCIQVLLKMIISIVSTGSSLQGKQSLLKTLHLAINLLIYERSSIFYIIFIIIACQKLEKSLICCSLRFQWVEEKTGGRIPANSVASISIQLLRKGGPDAVCERLCSLEKVYFIVKNYYFRLCLDFLPTNVFERFWSFGPNLEYRDRFEFIHIKKNNFFCRKYVMQKWLMFLKCYIITYQKKRNLCRKYSQHLVNLSILYLFYYLKHRMIPRIKVTP